MINRVLSLKTSILIGVLGLTLFGGSLSKATESCDDKLRILADPKPAELKLSPEDKATGKELAEIYKLEAATPDLNSSILGEKHKLTDLLLNDSNKNLGVQSPFIIMNAAQRMLALIYSQGHSKVRQKLSGEEVDFYPFFSSGTQASKGLRIVGNEKALAEFVNNLKAQAVGDRTGSAVVLLVANAGTGKSETLKILGAAAENLTSNDDAKFASYTYTWTNLGAIKPLHQFLPPTEVAGEKVYPEIDAPMGDSPYTLLPAEYQKFVVEKSRAQAEKLLEGMVPVPFAHPDPWSQFIRNQIIQHYAKELGHNLSASEIVDALNKHIIVKRQILGQSYGKMPLIDAQGNDIDVQGLFMTPNPVVRFASGVGPTHVMSWYLNGKILQGHGNAVLFDEFFRNPKELRDMLLGGFESRKLSVGGAPTVPFDAVMIAATNTASLDDAMAEGKTKGRDGQNSSTAAVDRFRVTPMRWSVDPGEIAKLMLYSKAEVLHQQNLVEENGPVTRGNLDELLPRTERLSRTLSPDGRYRVWFGEGSQKVDLAPHTLMTMAEIIAATRMETSPDRAKQVFNGKVTTSNVFRNPIDRIRLLEGLKPDAQPDELKELAEVTLLLKEGETGISSRDAMKWLTASIEAAKSDRTGFTLTPGVLLKKFRSMLSEGSIVSSSHKARLEWMEIAKEVTDQLLVPRLDADIARALANGDQVVQKAYFDILDEMFAIHENPDARVFTSSTTGQEHSIDRERLDKIKEIFVKRNGRPLNIDQIAIFHARQKAVGGAAPVSEESLLEAVAQYYASLNTQVAGFASLVDFEKTGTGSDEVKAAHSSLVTAMKAMGYNTVAIRDALLLINDQKSRSQAP